jgi:hypothetical protein
LAPPIKMFGSVPAGAGVEILVLGVYAEQINLSHQWQRRRLACLVSLLLLVCDCVLVFVVKELG